MRLAAIFSVTCLALLQLPAAEEAKKEPHPLLVIAEAQRLLKDVRVDMDDGKVLKALKIPASWEVVERSASASSGHTRIHGDPSEKYFVVVETSYWEGEERMVTNRIRLVEIFVRSTRTRSEAGVRQQKAVDIRLGESWKKGQIIDEPPFFFDGSWEPVEAEPPLVEPESQADKATAR